MNISSDLMPGLFKYITSVKGILAALVAIIGYVGVLATKVNFSLPKRLKKELESLEEINDLAASIPGSSDKKGSYTSTKEVKRAKDVESSGQNTSHMAVTFLESRVYERICWLLFAHETNDLQNERHFWRISLPPSIYAVFMALLSIFPVAAVVVFAKNTKDQQSCQLAYIFTIGWLLIFFFVYNVSWWDLRRSIFLEKLKPRFWKNTTELNISKLLEEQVEDFKKGYTEREDGKVVNIRTGAWCAMAVTALLMGLLCYYGSNILLWVFLFLFVITLLICCVWEYCVQHPKFKLAEKLKKYVCRLLFTIFSKCRSTFCKFYKTVLRAKRK